MDTPFRVDGIDHVEVQVGDRYEAARWYRDVLGLEIMKDFEFWAEPAGGPLMISSDGGQTKLALFQGEPQADHPAVGIRRIAFSTGASGFIDFARRAMSQNVFGRDGKPLSRDHIIDHGQSFSIYFRDPWGNLLELTTYDVEPVRREM
jgi:catechol 2,3-dioxygenase-like lactoylglutathione lyase family enzyme